MARTMKVKKGDLVQILSGKDRGKQGRILEAQPDKRRVIVENLNVVKRHTKPRPLSNPSRMGQAQMSPGGVIDRPAPVSVSNVMLVCPTCRRATRVGIELRERKGGLRRVRVCKRADCGQEIDK